MIRSCPVYAGSMHRPPSPYSSLSQTPSSGNTVTFLGTGTPFRFLYPTTVFGRIALVNHHNLSLVRKVSNIGSPRPGETV